MATWAIAICAVFGYDQVRELIKVRKVPKSVWIWIGTPVVLVGLWVMILDARAARDFERNATAIASAGGWGSSEIQQIGIKESNAEYSGDTYRQAFYLMTCEEPNPKAFAKMNRKAAEYSYEVLTSSNFPYADIRRGFNFQKWGYLIEVPKGAMSEWYEYRRWME